MFILFSLYRFGYSIYWSMSRIFRWTHLQKLRAQKRRMLTWLTHDLWGQRIIAFSTYFSNTQTHAHTHARTHIRTHAHIHTHDVLTWFNFLSGKEKRLLQPRKIILNSNEHENIWKRCKWIKVQKHFESYYWKNINDFYLVFQQDSDQF